MVIDLKKGLIHACRGDARGLIIDRTDGSCHIQACPIVHQGCVVSDIAGELIGRRRWREPLYSCKSCLICENRTYITGLCRHVRLVMNRVNIGLVVVEGDRITWNLPASIGLVHPAGDVGAKIIEPGCHGTPYSIGVPPQAKPCRHIKGPRIIADPCLCYQ